MTDKRDLMVSGYVVDTSYRSSPKKFKEPGFRVSSRLEEYKARVRLKRKFEKRGSKK